MRATRGGLSNVCQAGPERKGPGEVLSMITSSLSQVSRRLVLGARVYRILVVKSRLSSAAAATLGLHFAPGPCKIY